MHRLRRPLAAGEVVGYLIFFAGILLGIGLAMSQHWQDPREGNPFIPLLAIWIVAGVTYKFLHAFGLFVGRRPAAGKILGYAIFFTGIILLGIGLAMDQDKGDSIFIFLLATWILTAVTHRFVRAFLLACAVSTFAVMVVVWVWNLISYGRVTDMAAAGTIMFGFFAFLISLAVGLPFLIYRRASTRRG